MPAATGRAARRTPDSGARRAPARHGVERRLVSLREPSSKNRCTDSAATITGDQPGRRLPSQHDRPRPEPGAQADRAIRTPRSQAWCAGTPRARTTPWGSTCCRRRAARRAHSRCGPTGCRAPPRTRPAPSRRPGARPSDGSRPPPSRQPRGIGDETRHPSATIAGMLRANRTCNPFGPQRPAHHVLAVVDEPAVAREQAGPLATRRDDGRRRTIGEQRRRDEVRLLRSLGTNVALHTSAATSSTGRSSPRHSAAARASPAAPPAQPSPHIGTRAIARDKSSI